MISGGSSPQGVPGVGKKADAVADRSGVPLLYNHACLHQGSPYPEGKAFRLSRLSYPAPAPCRSGCRGEAPCSLPRSEIPVQESVLFGIGMLPDEGAGGHRHCPGYR